MSLGYSSRGKRSLSTRKVAQMDGSRALTVFRVPAYASPGTCNYPPLFVLYHSRVYGIGGKGATGEAGKGEGEGGVKRVRREIVLKYLFHKPNHECITVSIVGSKTGRGGGVMTWSCYSD